MYLLQTPQEGEMLMNPSKPSEGQAIVFVSFYQDLESQPDHPPEPQRPPPGPLLAQTEPEVKIYDLEDVRAKLDATAHLRRDREEAEATSRLLKKMLERGGERRLRRLPQDWEQQLLAVRAGFPNFHDLFEYLLSMCALAVRHDCVLHTDPVLLVGPPGVGKTMVIEEISQIVAGGLDRIALASSQSSSLLGGSEEFWSNSKPGLVFRTLVDGDYANPILLLDEIDKVSENERYSPLGPLFDLLEPLTARRFTDLSVQDVPIDASRVLWFATANDHRTIHDAIYSRLHVIMVDKPTEEQSAAVVASIDARLKRDIPATVGVTLSDAAIRILARLPPRAARKALLIAYGKAVRANRSVVDAGDVEGVSCKQKTIGFA